jgi:hypothetical protein
MFWISGIIGFYRIRPAIGRADPLASGEYRPADTSGPAWLRRGGG